jgi:hypothetical protein
MANPFSLGSYVLFLASSQAETNPAHSSDLFVPQRNLLSLRHIVKQPGSEKLAVRFEEK